MIKYLGSFEFFEDVGNDFEVINKVLVIHYNIKLCFYSSKVLGFLSHKTGNQYKRMPYKIGPYKFCKFFDKEEYFMKNIRIVSDVPAKGTCPWPKGKYTVDGYAVRFQKKYFILLDINVLFVYKLNITSFPPVLSSG